MNIVVYWNIQNHAFVNYDDQLYVTSNHKTQAGIALKSVFDTFTDIHTGNWHPITMMSHMLDWQLFGEKAGGHHWTSLIIHIFNTILLFVLLNTLTGAIWRSFLVATLFAIHPINVESVAWIAERKNVLSTFFWMMTMLLYVWYVKQPGWKRYLPVFLCFSFGLMSKPMLVTLPFVLLLLDYWPLNRTVINTQNENQAEIQTPLKKGKAKLHFLIMEKIPLFILTAISICVTLYTQHHVKAVVSMDSLPILKRINNAIVSYGLYIKKMFWPIDLSVFYPQYNIGLGKLFLASSFLMILSAMVIRYYKKHPYLLVGWCWFLGTLVPVIGLVQVGAQSMADRYAYVPFIGLFIMLVWYLAEIAKRNAYIKFSLIVLSVVVILTLSVLSWQRCQVWGDQFALWNNVLKNHKVAFAYNFRGLAYADKGQYSLALRDYNIAIERDKKFMEALNNRGTLYLTIGQYKNALKDYDEAQRLNPKFADTYYNRGLLYLEMNKMDAAVADFTTAINIDPNMADYFNNRGVALRLKGEYEKSFADFNQALKLKQNFAEAYFNRGMIFQIHSQYFPAIINYTEALRIKPDYADARFRRGTVFVSLGKHDQAMKDFNHVIQIDSNHIDAFRNLGIILKNMKKYDESSWQFKKILQIKPNDQEALKNLKEIEDLKKKN